MGQQQACAIEAGASQHAVERVPGRSSECNARTVVIGAGRIGDQD